MLRSVESILSERFPVAIQTAEGSPVRVDEPLSQLIRRAELYRFSSGSAHVVEGLPDLIGSVGRSLGDSCKERVLTTFRESRDLFEKIISSATMRMRFYAPRMEEVDFWTGLCRRSLSIVQQGPLRCHLPTLVAFSQEHLLPYEDAVILIQSLAQIQIAKGYVLGAAVLYGEKIVHLNRPEIPAFVRGEELVARAWSNVADASVTSGVPAAEGIIPAEVQPLFKELEREVGRLRSFAAPWLKAGLTIGVAVAAGFLVYQSRSQYSPSDLG